MSFQVSDERRLSQLFYTTMNEDPYICDYGINPTYVLLRIVDCLKNHVSSEYIELNARSIDKRLLAIYNSTIEEIQYLCRAKQPKNIEEMIVYSIGHLRRTLIPKDDPIFHSISIMKHGASTIDTRSSFVNKIKNSTYETPRHSDSSRYCIGKLFDDSFSYSWNVPYIEYIDIMYIEIPMNPKVSPVCIDRICHLCHVKDTVYEYLDALYKKWYLSCDDSEALIQMFSVMCIELKIPYKDQQTVEDIYNHLKRRSKHTDTSARYDDCLIKTIL